MNAVATPLLLVGMLLLFAGAYLVSVPRAKGSVM